MLRIKHKVFINILIVMCIFFMFSRFWETKVSKKVPVLRGLSYELYLFFNPIISADATPINQEWNIEPKDSRLTKEFTLTRYLAYDLTLEFIPLHPICNSAEAIKLGVFMYPDNKLAPPCTNTEHEEQLVLNAFAGEASKGLYILKINKYMIFDTNEKWEQAQELIKAGEAIWKHAKPGVIVPVHLKIERFDKNNVASIITDKNIDTEGGTSRTVASLKLKPGRYRLNINTNKETILPPNIKTLLVLNAAPDAFEFIDNE